MKKLEKKYIVILTIVCTILFFSLIFYEINNSRTSIMIEKGIKDSVLFVEKIALFPIQFVEKKINQYDNYKTVSKNYEIMNEKVESFDRLMEEKKELEQEIEELKNTLQLKQIFTNYDCITATVINRNVGYWFDTLTIDKGSKDKIKTGAAVIINQGLIGEIVNVSNHYSTIKLLTNNSDNNKISIKINLDGKEIIGLMTGYDEKKNVFNVEGIGENVDIPIGTNIVTAGIANGYPPGILIGTVSNINTDNFDLAKTLEVTPSVNFNDIKYVTILNEVKE